MKKYLIVFILMIVITSCGIFNSLTSTTTIKPNDSFVLGKNQHSSFKAKVTNLSQVDIELYEITLDGILGNKIILKPSKTIILAVEKNIGIVVENKSNNTINVGIKVTGDTGLTMGYKN